MVGSEVGTFLVFEFFDGLDLCSAKRDKRKAWDEEWGNLDTEGNIWWRGSAYEEWVDVMGKSWLGWICTFT